MPARLIDLTGQRFGRLVVHHRAPAELGKKPKWVCVCDCGGMRMVEGKSLRSGETTSCGCFQREDIARRRTQHGARRLAEATPVGDDRRRVKREYASWEAMRTRCLNPKGAGYAEYGGRGITICARWESFENFLADMGPRPLGTSLDRREVNGNYEPTNCRWATRSEQMLNRRGTRKVTDDEVAMIGSLLRVGQTLAAISRTTGISVKVIKRIRTVIRRAADADA